MGEVIVDSTELERIVFGNIHNIELMDSPLPIEDRMRILHREVYVESDGSTMRIHPIGSDNVVLLELSAHPPIEEDCRHLVGAVFHDTIPGPDVSLAFCHFITDADFHDAVIQRLTTIGCIFESNVRMEQTTFAYAAVMDGSTFLKDAVFTGSFFGREASFCHCTFRGRCDFNSSQFIGKASFRSSHFHGVTDFDDATFRDKALFDRQAFKDDHTPTEPSYFHGSVSFKSARFDHYAVFHETRFLSKAEFNSAVFNSKTFFEGNADDKPVCSDMVFKSTRFGTYTCIADLQIGNIIFETVTCQGELMLCDVILRSGLTITEFASSGYTTIRNLNFINGPGTFSIMRSTFNGDLDINLMSSNASHHRLGEVIVSTCWVTGHFHLAGCTASLDMRESTFNGPVAIDIQGDDEARFSLNLLNATVNSSAQFRWISVKDINDSIEGDVVSPISSEDLFLAVRGHDKCCSRFSEPDLAYQMLVLRNIMTRMGRFDDSDFFLRKYNSLQRRFTGHGLPGRCSSWVSGAGSFVARVIGSYGTRPGQILLWMVIVPLIIGMSIGFIRGDAVDGLLDGFVAFITMSLGVDTSGLGDMEKVLLVADGFLGVFLMSFFVTSLARKLFR